MKQLALHHLKTLKAFIKVSCTAYATDTIKVLEACGFTDMSYDITDNVSIGFENIMIKASFNGHIILINPTTEAGMWFVRKLSPQEVDKKRFVGSKMTNENLFRVNSISGLQRKLQ